MLYAKTKGLVLRLFKAPTEPPAPPRGEHETVEVFRASPRFLAYRLLGLGLLGAVLGMFAMLMFGIAIVEEPGAAIVGGAVLLFAVPLMALSYFLVQLDYDLRYYVVTERSVRVREGAWNVREKTLTYANVQNLRVTQGPLQRMFGIRDLRIDAAGGGGVATQGGAAGGHNVVIAGIDNAPELRDRIQAFLRAYRAGAGLGDPDDRDEAFAGSVFAGAEVMAELTAMRSAASGMRAAAELGAGAGGGAGLGADGKLT